MTEKQIEPQFIFWEKQEGVFRPAILDFQKNSGYDLEKNVAIQGDALVLGRDIEYHSGVPLEGIDIFEPFISMQETEYSRESNLRKILDSAKEVAQKKIVSYFSVDILKAPKNTSQKHPAVFGLGLSPQEEMTLKPKEYKKFLFIIKDNDREDKLEKYSIFDKRDKELGNFKEGQNRTLRKGVSYDLPGKELHLPLRDALTMNFVLRPTAQLYVAKR